MGWMRFLATNPVSKASPHRSTAMSNSHCAAAPSPRRPPHDLGKLPQRDAIAGIQLIDQRQKPLSDILSSFCRIGRHRGVRVIHGGLLRRHSMWCVCAGRYAQCEGHQPNRGPSRQVGLTRGMGVPDEWGRRYTWGHGGVFRRAILRHRRGTGYRTLVEFTVAPQLDQPRRPDSGGALTRRPIVIDAIHPSTNSNGGLAGRRWGILERVMGIEPTLAAWEAAVLPLNYTRVVAEFSRRAPT